MSDLRHAQDSTAASNISSRFPMTPEEALKFLSPYMWDVEKREVFEYQTIYFFPIEERKKQKNNGMTTDKGGLSDMGVYND